jgi:polysaccharide pyruvyl transferase WcaK-like protein
MRVLIDSDNSSCGNMGDLAMLQVAVRRLRELWPNAHIDVISGAPDLLVRHCPGVVPVSATGRYTWAGDDYLLGPLHRLLSSRGTRTLGGVKRALGRRWPGPLRTVVGGKARLRGMASADPGTFVEALRDADLYVVCGLGGLTDSAKVHSRLMLDTAELAMARDMPVVFFSQGVGPCRDPDLLALMRAVLPKASLIAVRERLRAPERLRVLGVAADRIMDTGDDAIEPAYAARPARLGASLGVNVRVAPYAGIDRGFIDRLRDPLRAFSSTHGAAFEPLPITRHSHARDADTLRELLAGENGSSDGGLALDTPDQVIAAAGRCRLVVTGAYHAAVFALAQGVSAVCLAGSEYYLDKFAGLAELFGPGCEVVNTGPGDSIPALIEAMERAWTSADERRSGLQTAALRQIACGRAAYARLPTVVGQPVAADRDLHSFGRPDVG